MRRLLLLVLVGALLMLAALAGRVLMRRGLAPSAPPVTHPVSSPEAHPADGRLKLEATPAARSVRLRWKWTAGAVSWRALRVIRTTFPLEERPLDRVRYPVCTIEVRAGGTSRPRGGVSPSPHAGMRPTEWLDDTAPDGVTCHYQLEAVDEKGRSVFSNVVSAGPGPRALPAVQRPVLRVDKSRYVLCVGEVDGVDDVKRYPIALGRNPSRRKLHQDNASTPEGAYRISGLQPSATFYRAYDLDYPTDLDRVRYELALREGRVGSEGGAVAGIGGEIQIHGKGIAANWTFGCIALRNEDMDELFRCEAIARGVPVLIYGGELGRADCEALWRGFDVEGLKKVQVALKDRGFDVGGSDGHLGRRTMEALGSFQVRSGLPLTCLPDATTLEKLMLASPR